MLTCRAFSDALRGSTRCEQAIFLNMTLDIPEDVACRPTAMLPADERDRFAVTAIADALTARRREADGLLAEALLDEIDPEAEPERERSERREAVEAALADVDANRNMVTLEEARSRRPHLGATRANADAP